MAIKLDMGKGPAVKKEAFKKPSADEELLWDSEATGPLPTSVCHPYLVHVTHYVEHERVTFLGVDKETGEHIAGAPHTVSLGNSAVVVPGPPSTLTGYDETRCYAILFLSGNYPRIEELKLAWGGGKYPKGLPGSFDRLKTDLKEFRGSLTGETADAFDRVFAEYLTGE